MALFEPLTLRDCTFANRVWISPMCQYSATGGLPNSWHEVHLGGFAVGGAGLVLSEATAVTPVGRISPGDLGLWSDEHAEHFAPIVDFAHRQGTRFGIQLAHAGRKASTAAPWEGNGYVAPDAGGWQTLGPSAIAFGRLPVPAEMSVAQIAEVTGAFAAAAVRADRIGCDVVEIHGAHGYLIHSFLSPLTNRRTDRYGGTFDGRIRIAVEIATAVRRVWPAGKPLFFRISATDWVAGGWTSQDSVELARQLVTAGVDLVDCSSGGLVPDATIPLAPGYQVHLAAAVRAGAGVATGAVGLITEPDQAEAIVAHGQADAVLLGRAALRDPHWPLRAAGELGVSVPWPDQYLRARP